jgi:hypothetical protein
VRLRAPIIASRAEVCRRIAEDLAQSTGAANKVSVNIITGSIIIEAPAGDVDADTLLARLRECVQTEASQFPPKVSGSTKIVRSVARAFAALNADIRGELDHHADLAALFPVILATVGIFKIVTAGELHAPSWYNFCWWSFRAFMTFHKDAAKEPDDAEPLSPPTNVDAPDSP